MADIVADNKRTSTPSTIVLEKKTINLNGDDTMKVRFSRVSKRGELLDNINVEGTFPNLKKSFSRFRKSTKMTNLKLAIKEGTELARKEYKYRLSYGQASRSLTNQGLIEKYIDYITDQTENEMVMSRSVWNEDNLKKHKGNALKHILPNLPDKKLQLLNRIDIQNLVIELKKTVSVKTIANVRTTFNQIWDYAESIGIVQGNPPKFPPLSTKKQKDGQGYAHATPKQVLESLESIDNELLKNDLTDFKRHKLFVYRRWLVFLIDCGFRPFYKPGNPNRLPLTVDKQTKNSIFFKRFEKDIHYIARGGKASIQAVRELEDYYKEQGINNEELIVHIDGKPFSKKAWETLVKDVQKITGWIDMTDKHGRPLVPYSIRHQHITTALEKDEEIVKLAKRCGTSVEMIMTYYYEHDFYKTEKTDSIL